MHCGVLQTWKADRTRAAAPVREEDTAIPMAASNLTLMHLDNLDFKPQETSAVCDLSSWTET
jgi:hypothetical protein